MAEATKEKMALRITLTIVVSVVLSSFLTYFVVALAVGPDPEGYSRPDFWGFILMGCISVSVVSGLACLPAYFALSERVKKNPGLLLLVLFGLLMILNAYFLYLLVTSERKEIEDKVILVVPMIIFVLAQVSLLIKIRNA